MSNLRNGHVALLILGVKGHSCGGEGRSLGEFGLAESGAGRLIIPEAQALIRIANQRQPR